MANINKRQVSIAVLAVVFATAMIVSVIATSDNAFANRNHHKHHHHHSSTTDNSKHLSQSISQANVANQKSTVVTAGANSPVVGSGNNVAVQSNDNDGGNAAAQ